MHGSAKCPDAMQSLLARTARPDQKRALSGPSFEAAVVRETVPSSVPDLPLAQLFQGSMGMS